MSGDPVPPLCRGLVVLPVGERLVVRAADRRHVFRGRAATTLLPRLLPLLDGTRSVAALADASGVPERHVDRVLEALRDRSLLDLVPAAADASVPDPVLDHHAGSLDGNGGHPGTGALLGALAEVAVRVVGPPSLAPRIAADLRESGLLRALAGPVDRPALAALREASRALAVVVEDPADPELTERVVARCGPLGVPVLRAAAYPESVEIGPRFLPGHAACPACLRRARAAAGRAPDAGGDPVADELLVGLVGAEALALAAGAAAERAMAVTTVDLATFTIERHLAVPEPDCPCDDIGGAGTEPDLVDVQLWAATPAAGPALRPGTPTRAFRRLARELTGERPAYHNRPRRLFPTAELPLPAGAFGAERPEGGARLDGTVLADLLMRAAGRRQAPGDPPGPRWTPSGGNLGSVELYLATAGTSATFGLPELPGTLFRYDDLGHALVALRAEGVPLSVPLAETDLPAEGTEALLVCVAAHARVALKYQGFAHGLCHLDAGCATTQIAAVAGARGLGLRFASHWTEGLAELLDLIPDRQYVTAVAGLRGGEPCP
ncbi:hypothetical protein [Streptomyces sedi]|uniref:hypothetical protein n=1 Tax=Streptomyces sedi TaxID=555059 RepID=UPI0014768D09|nr:hypothetical protein [Streptomyces sedi]